jgi:hypothetical protein
MAQIVRNFRSFTKEGDEEYTVEVSRVDNDYTASVKATFKNCEPIDRTFSVSGEDGEHKVQEWLFALDEEVRAMIEKKNLTSAVEVAEEVHVEAQELVSTH